MMILSSGVQCTKLQQVSRQDSIKTFAPRVGCARSVIVFVPTPPASRRSGSGGVVEWWSGGVVEWCGAVLVDRQPSADQVAADAVAQIHPSQRQHLSFQERHVTSSKAEHTLR